MIRRTPRLPLSQGDAAGAPAKKQDGARNHHITEFFKPSTKPETDALITSMKLQAQDRKLWNKASCTSQRPRKIPSSTNLSPIDESCMSVHRENAKIVRNYEKYCPNCGKSLLSPRVLLKRLVLPVNSLVYSEDKEGYKIISDDFKAAGVFSSDNGRHLPSIKHRSRSRSEGLLGRVYKSSISRQNKCSPLRPHNILRSDLQTPLDLCQDGITQKKNMSPAVYLEKTLSNQFGVQVSNITTTLKRKFVSDNCSDSSGTKKSFTECCKTDDISQNTGDLNHFISASTTQEGYQHGDNVHHSYQSSTDLENGRSPPVILRNVEPGTPLRTDSRMVKTTLQYKSPLCRKRSSSAEEVDLALPAPGVSSSPEASLKKQTSDGVSLSTSDSEESFYGFLLSEDDDEEEESFKPLDQILQLAAKPIPRTPQSQNLNTSFLSISPASYHGTPATKRVTPSLYVNNLDRLVKEQEETKRLNEIEKQLHEDLEKGLGVGHEEQDSAEDGELTDEHREFLQKFTLVSNAIPDQHPGEEVFHLSESGAIFNVHSLDLKYSEISAENSEEGLIFSCGQENQILLATEGFLTFLYRFKKCPDFLMKWMFQMISVHPSYTVSVKLLHTLIEISCNNLSNLQEQPWTPSLLDIATVFANMGIHLDTLFPLQHIQPNFSSKDLGPALSLAGLSGNRLTQPIFSHVPEFQIAHLIKFLGFCSAACGEHFCDWEIITLIVLLLKMHLEKELKDFPVMDLHSLLENLLQNIKAWETAMPEVFYAISELTTHHHNFIKLLQLIPTTENRGRQLRKHLSLMFMSNILNGSCTEVPLDYDSQMELVCHLMSQMRPSSLMKKMQKCPDNVSKSSLDLDQEAYYLTFSLLHLVNDASSSDEPPSKQRKYLLKLCTELEKHIKSDIREDARYFYRTKVKDLVARIHGRWQELLLYSRPNQGKIHDYWEPVCDSSSPNSSQENLNDAPQDFSYDDN
ncbi:hypothetical protein GDO81_004168 [Engystomops pustulosus]|uniref:Coiled-coil SMC6 And NSE5 INteracting (CANIN) domain-containing protein n=1 Tax=Engystomops pustulosus TaxID=76066 RepID=A0AAV6ZUB4_ENGPU|nr:hypothetical protein GDO81_004168 [Engystomops pustulosus]